VKGGSGADDFSGHPLLHFGSQTLPFAGRKARDLEVNGLAYSALEFGLGNDLGLDDVLFLARLQDPAAVLFEILLMLAAGAEIWRSIGRPQLSQFSARSRSAIFLMTDWTVPHLQR
jgi:hypothetical protein